MWKILFLFVLVVAFTDAKFELKGRPRQRLRMSLEEECEKYSKSSKSNKAYMAMLAAMSCLYDDKEIETAFTKFGKINSSGTFLDATTALCSQRRKILPCYRTLLEAAAPCAPPAVRDQIDSLQESMEKMAEMICEDDCVHLRKFIADGAYECAEANNDRLNLCTANVTDLITEVPEDTTTFAAIDACFRYDALVSCFNDVLKTCPKKTTLNYLNTLFTQFRKGTYCHITLPLEKDEDLTNEKSEENAESSAENNKL